MKHVQHFMLAGVKWRVIYAPPPSEPESLGATERDQAVIYINPSFAPQIQQATFFHELLHAIQFTRGIADDHDEVEIDATANLLHQFYTTVQYE